MLTLAAETAAGISPLFSVESAIALLTLTALEIVLGIDNIVFISILTGKLPEEQRAKARRVGLAVALVARILLLLSIFWIMKLEKPLFTTPVFWPFTEGMEISGKDLVLIAGGLFLIIKATKEIHHKIEGHESASGSSPDPARRLGAPRYGSIIIQIMLIDIVFSLDSVITAVGMSDHVQIMIAAVIIAVGVMMLSVNLISNFVEKNPTIKMLALAFLMLIGVMLVGEGIDQHLPKGMIYFAMAFSLGVEFLNMRAAAKAKRGRV
jgi:predicted tellurium resistance membrane protein TerC